MLYAFIDSRSLKLLKFKKSLLGQYEVAYFDKKHTVDLLKGGEINNLDLFASALKEGLSTLGVSGGEDVLLILPQESLSYVVTQVPPNYSASSLEAFVKDKLETELGVTATDLAYDYIATQVDGHQNVGAYAIKREVARAFEEALRLLNMKLVGILPEALCYFTLFVKTLRAGKKEHILYVSYNEGEVTGYLYDSYGLVSRKRWVEDVEKDEEFEKALKDKVKELDAKNIKLSRIILSGPKSEKIRQDTFTKKVGAWTNPLKRIIPHFYQEYLKVLMTVPDKAFPILTFDAPFGAFVFTQENKKFNILRNYSRKFKRRGGGGGGNKKALMFAFIFVLSFGASFLALWGLSRAGALSYLQSATKSLEKTAPTATEEPEKKTTNPTPIIKKESLRVKVLNGSGTAGKANELKNLLIEKGYEQILTDNADNFEYEVTVIQVKKSKKVVVDTLKEDISESVKSPKVETLDEDDPSDVIIIIGADYK